MIFVANLEESYRMAVKKILMVLGTQNQTIYFVGPNNHNTVNPLNLVIVG
jgi:hypothetical protein